MAFTFVDLFAGIGGFHLAITNVFPNAECVWASELVACQIRFVEP